MGGSIIYARLLKNNHMSLQVLLKVLIEISRWFILDSDWSELPIAFLNYENVKNGPNFWLFNDTSNFMQIYI